MAVMAKSFECAACWAVAVFGLLLAAPVARAVESVEPDPAAITDPVEREFQGRLQELRERQKVQTHLLQARKDLTPEQRLERRRVLINVHQKEIQALEAQYQSRVSPEARSRWMERKATRQKKFDKLKRSSRDSSVPQPGHNTGGR
jgi:hypothetical protein